MRNSTLLLLLFVLVLTPGCMTSPKVEVKLENSRGNHITITAPATGDPTKTITTDAKATSLP